MKKRFTFYVSGSGISPRADVVTNEEKAVAIEHALRHAASAAADRVTPRRVRESILLDASAPAFEDGYSMIEASRFAEAKAIWERAMRNGGARSAPLRFNLGAICEAMGDRRAAELHYNAARQLNPDEPRYAQEVKLFARRGSP
jgi:tetratricopeptide (TPR) repeat protein